MLGLDPPARLRKPWGDLPENQRRREAAMTIPSLPVHAVLPRRRDLYYGGQWRDPRGGYVDTLDPTTGRSLGPAAEADADDVDAAVEAAQAGFLAWRRLKPLDRAALLREFAELLRRHAGELALLEALNAGSPMREIHSNVLAAAASIDFCAGVVTEVKGDTIPTGEDAVKLSLREPYGVCGHIVAFNHPLIFVASRLAAALATGNSVIMRPPQEAPLSTYRAMELCDGLLPPGVLNLVTGGPRSVAALANHPGVPHVSMTGSVAAGQAVAQAAAAHLKQVSLDLGGKNACVVYPDADLAQAAEAAVRGMNFAWCGQPAGSASRLFLHEAVHDQVLEQVLERVRCFRPGLPTRMETTMGALISRTQRDQVLSHIETARREGALLVRGGRPPTDPQLVDGFFIEPTIFTGVTQRMRIAREEVSGPVLSVLKWHDEDAMFDLVNGVDHSRSASVWTRSLATAHRAIARIRPACVWVNHAGTDSPSASPGGYEQSGSGREEGLDELLSFTRLKNVHIVFGNAAP
jgi:betaine-aldehyde dehydrogenase